MHAFLSEGRAALCPACRGAELELLQRGAAGEEQRRGEEPGALRQPCRDEQPHPEAQRWAGGEEQLHGDGVGPHKNEINT